MRGSCTINKILREVYVMKRILLIVFILILTTVSAFAAEATENQLDARKAIDAIKEIRYNIEAGVNITTYNSVVSKAGVECRRYADKYPHGGQDIYPKEFLNMMRDPYVDAGKVWFNAIYDRSKTIDSDGMSILFANYPILKNKLTPKYLEDRKGKIIPSTEYYWYEDVMRALWSLAYEQEKILDIKAAE
jgi:hypothetical protein